MHRLKSTALTVAACAALLVTIPAFAQTPTGTPTTAASNTVTLHNPHDVSCGKITELGPDHAVLLKDNGSSVRILLGANTRFVARSYAAAQAGLKENDYAAVAGGDGATAPAHAFLYALVDFCGQQHGQSIRVKGIVTDFNQNTVTVTAPGHDPYIFGLTGATKFYVNGRQVQVPDFQRGEAASVLAREEQDGSYTALVVRLRAKA